MEVGSLLWAEDRKRQLGMLLWMLHGTLSPLPLLFAPGIDCPLLPKQWPVFCYLILLLLVCVKLLPVGKNASNSGQMLIVP